MESVVQRDSGSGTSPSRNHADDPDLATSRRRRLAVLIALSVSSALAGLVAGRALIPAVQVAASAEPPPPSVITAPVESKVLVASIVGRADVVRLAATELTHVPMDSSQGIAVLTRQPPAPGDEVQEGDVIGEVSGRPLIVLAGEIPSYRDLSPGSVGPDVRQLEESLARLGRDPGPIDGVYDDALDAAVRGLYQSLGYQAPDPPPEALSVLASAEALVTAASDRVDELQRSIADAEAQPSASELLRLAASMAAANEQVEVAQLQLELVQARADLSARAADHAVSVASAAVDDAREALAEAEASGDDAEIDDRRADLNRAEAELELARRQRQITLEENALQILQAETAVDQARRQLEVEEAARAESMSSEVPSDLVAQLAKAEADLKQAEKNRDLAAREVGAVVPRAEIRFVPTLPRAVQSVALGLGEVVEGPLLTLAGEDILLRARINTAEGALVEVGDEVVIELDRGATVTGTLVEIVVDPADPADVTLEIAVAAQARTRLEEHVGRNVRIEIPTASTSGKVLAVPLAALSATSDGRSRVQVVIDPASVHDVIVEAGLVADGLVEVEPIDGNLAEGDEVIVGAR